MTTIRLTARFSPEDVEQLVKERVAMLPGLKKIVSIKAVYAGGRFDDPDMFDGYEVEVVIQSEGGPNIRDLMDSNVYHSDREASDPVT